MDGTLRGMASFLVPESVVNDTFYDAVEKALYNIRATEVSDICKKMTDKKCLISTGFEIKASVDVDDSECYHIPAFVDNYGDWYPPEDNYEPVFKYDGNGIVVDILNSLKSFLSVPVKEVSLTVNHVSGSYFGNNICFDVNDDLSDQFTARCI